MKNGTCPKCNSTEVYRGFASADHGTVYLDDGDSRKFAVGLDFYLCANCGYAEWYASEDEKKNWPTLVKDERFWKKVG